MKIKSNYKHSAVGIIPIDWGVVILSDILRSAIQNGVFTEPSRKGRGSKLVNVIDLYKKFPIDIRDLDLFAADKTEILRYGLKSGDILFTRSSLTAEGIAQCNVCDKVDSEQIVYDCHLIRIQPNNNLVNSFFVARYCGSRPARSYLIANAKTTTMTTIDQSVIANLPIPLPPLPEQQAIAEALSDVDQLIASLDQLIEKRRALKTATMQQLLTGKTRLAGFSGEWETKRLGDIANIQRGASPRPIDSPLWFDEYSNVGWVRISDVTQSGKTLTSTIQKLSSQGIKNSRFVRSDSLIMSICATVGRPIITKLDVCIHDGFVVFDNLTALNSFLYYVLKWIEPNWSKYGQTGSQMNLNTELIKNVEVLVPDSTEQQSIAEVLSDMDAEIAELEQRRDKTIAIKQGMMQELLTGRTRLI